MSESHSIAPALPSRSAVNFQARELAVLANRAIEFSTAGRGADLSAALLQLERMRAVLGDGQKGGADG
jgi:hypothetical protein